MLDDDPLARQVLARYFNAWQHRVDTFASPRQALVELLQAAAVNDPYGIAVIDLRMPEMDGMEFARRVREKPELRGLRLILVTAYDQMGQGPRALEAGFFAYLRKPVRQSDLYDCITEAPATSQPPPAVRTQPEANEKRILLVEDNAVNRDVALRQLARLGYAAQTAVHGAQAVEMAASGDYHVILMDCQMPVMDGFAATRAIRHAENRTGKRSRIIAMTANAMPGDRRRVWRRAWTVHHQTCHARKFERSALAYR